jgi:hypothetical protein
MVGRIMHIEKQMDTSKVYKNNKHAISTISLVLFIINMITLVLTIYTYIDSPLNRSVLTQREELLVVKMVR